MKQEIKKINDVNLENKTFSRRAFLGTLVASLATASLPGCCAFNSIKQSSTSNQNEQAQNQLEQGQPRRKIGENVTQADIDEVNRRWKKEGKEWSRQKDLEIQEEIQKDKARQQSQPQQPPQQRPQIQQQSRVEQQPQVATPQPAPTRPQEVTPQPAPTRPQEVTPQPAPKHPKGKVWKGRGMEDETKDNKANKRPKGRVWKGSGKDLEAPKADDTLEC